VTIVEMLPRIAPLEDEEISKELTPPSTNAASILSHRQPRPSIETTASGVKVHVSSPEANKPSRRNKPWSRWVSDPIPKISVWKKPGLIERTRTRAGG
jgi:hypothetical protein